MKNKNLARISLVLALLVVLDLTGIGLIRLPGLPAFTIMHVPVIVAGIVLGPKLGAVAGGGFGMIMMIEATFRPGSPIDMMFSPFSSENPIASIVMCIVPRILLGISAYYFVILIQKIFKNKERLVFSIAALLATVLHSILVLTMLATFFAAFPLASLFLTVVSINTLLEVLAAVLITAAITIPLKKFVK